MTVAAETGPAIEDISASNTNMAIPRGRELEILDFIFISIL